MSDHKRKPYEKPVSIDMGRVAPILGDTCSVGNGATDCPQGYNNSSVPVCSPGGLGADNDCNSGSSAGTFCWPSGSSAHMYCLAGSGFGVTSTGAGAFDQPSPLDASPDESEGDSLLEEPSPFETEPDETDLDDGSTGPGY